jgi:hypothetical protein
LPRFFQRVRFAVLQAKAHLEHLALTIHLSAI